MNAKLKSSRLKKVLAMITFAAFLFAGCFVFIGEFRVWVQHFVYETIHPGVVGGRCDGCDAVNRYPEGKVLDDTDTLAAFASGAGKKINVSGTVYKPNSASPAPGVILYIYHTNNKGYYTDIKGWVKTDSLGRFSFYTIRPAPYPGQSIPAHIHAVVKEPRINEYYISDFNFFDDPLLADFGQPANPRGGSGVLRAGPSLNGVQYYHRDILLGLNIPNYNNRW
ncbi:MAG TPA: hypothetical protein VD993_07725 [Chitinophagaceae bacterium]|nr:hypothetical protein [Chitinophagaceae bacterium]